MDPELSGGADASTDHVDASAHEEVSSTPNPIVEREAAPEPKSGKPVSIDDALDRAAAKVDAKDKAGKADPKAGKGEETADGAKPLKDGQHRDNGKFAKDPGKDGQDPAKAADGKPGDQVAGKDKPDASATVKPGDDAKPGADKATAADPKLAATQSQHQAPARFSADAKAAWETAPEPVRAEVNRMERELTQGLEKHRKAAERDASIGEFHELAEKHGTDVKTALTKYTNMETVLRENPLRGLEAICDNIGVSLKDVARIVLEQPADEASSQSDATIRDLRQKNTVLEERLAKVEGRFEQDDQNTVFKHIEDWAADKPHFELFAPHLAAEFRNDRSLSLDAAYDLVLQKHPVLAALTAAPAAAAKTDPKPAASNADDDDNDEERAAQTRKGSKTLKGAPAAGSTPAGRKRSASIDEALERAFADAG